MKKIALSKETVRTLDDPSMGAVLGGAPIRRTRTECYTHQFCFETTLLCPAQCVTI